MTTIPRSITPLDLCLDGESFAVDLANTLYGEPEVAIDHLEDAVSTATWFAQAPTAAGLVLPERWADPELDRLRWVRDATRWVLLGLADGATPDPAACATLSAAVALDPWELVLTAGPDRPESSLRPHRDREPQPVSQVALRCVLFLGSEQARLVRRCASPRCSMVFTPHHRSRRFCDPACGHAQRQSRYYRSSRRSDP